MKTLSISLYNRPKYTQMLLNHLDNCFDIDNYHIFICCEPNNAEVINYAQSFRPDQTTVIINPRIYGCNINIFQCLSLGFLHNNYHIHLEDDTIPGKDTLLYFEWARHRFEHDLDIFNVSGYVNVNNKTEHYREKTEDVSLVSKRQWFTPWGWATWKNRWSSLQPVFASSLNTTYSWDVTVHRFCAQKKEVFPRVSRIQNVGAELGTFVPNASWHSNHQYNEFWIESLSQYCTNFTEE